MVMTNSTHSKRKLYQCVSQLVVLVIRFMLWKQEGKMWKLGGFCPKVSAEQIGLYKALYQLLLQGEDVTMDNIAPVSHQILYSTFTMHFSLHNKVDSAFEQSLIFSILLLKPGHYLPANVLQQSLACIQQTCFSTIFHTAWLGSPDINYRMVEHTEEQDVNDEGYDEGEDEDDELGSGLPGLEIDDAKDENNEIDFQGPGLGRCLHTRCSWDLRWHAHVWAVWWQCQNCRSSWWWDHIWYHTPGGGRRLDLKVKETSLISYCQLITILVFLWTIVSGQNWKLTQFAPWWVNYIPGGPEWYMSPG